jgi:hypothetical protein
MLSSEYSLKNKIFRLSHIMPSISKPSAVHSSPKTNSSKSCHTNRADANRGSSHQRKADPARAATNGSLGFSGSLESGKMSLDGPAVAVQAVPRSPATGNADKTNRCNKIIFSYL